MKKINIYCKAIALVLLLASILSLFAACEKPTKEPPAGEENKDLIDISGYTIVRFEKCKPSVKRKTTALKNSIKDSLGLNLSVQEDWYNPNNPPDPNAKEILIDETNRTESKNAIAKLNENDDENAFIIDITENKIAIVGKTHGATLRGISYFINNYVMASQKGNSLYIAHGKSVVRDYSIEKTISIGNKFEMDVDMVSTVLGDVSKTPHFPSIIELQHQPDEKNNGKLIAAMSVIDSKPTLAYITESNDGGKTWKLLARPEETRKPKTGWAGSMAHIYELPEQIGNMPAGTLIYSSNAVNYERSSHIGVWKSTDCGKTWKEISIVASGGGTKEGVWEPYMIAHEGYLYCFYSDDSYQKYDQRIVYKRSKDGITWEGAVSVCAFDDFIDRPGMPVITKMGNGEFFLVYEYVLEGHPSNIYYKTTKDITEWDPSDPGTPVVAKSGDKTFSPAAGPSCVWTPAGGTSGTLFVTGQYQNGGVPQNSVFISLDYGKTWDIVENPLPYTPYSGYVTDTMAGYRPIMVLGSDSSVIHYINTTNTPEDKGIVQYAKLKVYE